jgi:hypothetical protein
VDVTGPACVLTAPPVALWNGSGMSTFRLLGHSNTAPTITARPMIVSNPITTLAAIGPIVTSEFACPCVCATPHRVCRDYWR